MLYPDKLNVYLIRVCGYVTPSSSIIGVGLCELTPSSYPTPDTYLGGLAPLPVTPALSGLPPTNVDFWTNRSPMPTPHMIVLPTCSYAAPTDEPRPFYEVIARDDTPQPPCGRRTRSQTAILLAKSHRTRTTTWQPTVDSPHPSLHRPL